MNFIRRCLGEMLAAIAAGLVRLARRVAPPRNEGEADGRRGN